jgi:hypothetical protein
MKSESGSSESSAVSEDYAGEEVGVILKDFYGLLANIVKLYHNICDEHRKRGECLIGPLNFLGRALKPLITLRIIRSKKSRPIQSFIIVICTALKLRGTISDSNPFSERFNASLFQKIVNNSKI